MKVLIINIFGIGDVLFTTPILTNIKAEYPEVEIGYLCNRRTEEVVLNHPLVKDVFVYERDEFDQLKKKSFKLWLKKWKELVHCIKSKKYDIAIDVSMNSMISTLSAFCGIPQRVGFNYKNRSKFLTKKIPLLGYEEKHVIEYYLDLLRAIDIPIRSSEMTLEIQAEHQQWAGEFLKKEQSSSQKVIGIIPGGGASWGKEAKYKRWPAENYAKLADKIIEKFSADIILMGSLEEVELCQKVADLIDHPVILACENTNIYQFAALAKQCDLNIVNDGGPLHIAVAAGARTLSIFGPVDERVYGPYPQRQHLVVTGNVPCRPCYRRFRRASCEHVSCLQTIAIEDVLRKVEEAL